MPAPSTAQVTNLLHEAGEPLADVVALDEALTALAAIDERKSQVVEMRYYWTMAKLWLIGEWKPGTET